jgi:hypothetical protein
VQLNAAFVGPFSLFDAVTVALSDPVVIVMVVVVVVDPSA